MGLIMTFTLAGLTVQAANFSRKAPANLLSALMGLGLPSIPGGLTPGV
jgi:hypothetical protein